ncbi:MAG TPA: hypothetical protein VFA89_20140 [Terriglobales bacterium]|nr:hypothetical protein [Terriglobales bacterium]
MSNVRAELATWLIQILELAMVLGTALLISSKVRHGRLHSPGLAKCESFLTRIARRRALAVIIPAVFVVVTRFVLIPSIGVPAPHWNDEFSYLLAADTFAHGRLTNPTHPMWRHLETFQIIEQPTYMSEYPPAQGMSLALGEFLDHPWIGQVLNTALLCSAITWMLQGWVPPGWAFYGGMLAALRIGILSYWINSYFVGALPALAGALLLGAWPRLKKFGRTRDAIILGVALVVLANTRPYEGLIFSVPFAVAMAVWLFAEERRGLIFRRVIAPLVLILVTGALATGYYYYRVTGSPVRMTYEVNRGTYATAPYFLWGKPRPEPVYRHAVIRDFYRWELRQFQSGRSFSGFLAHLSEKVGLSYRFFLGPLLTIPLLAFVLLRRSPRMRFPLLLAAFFLLGLVVQTWTMPHYASPATALVYLFVIEGARSLRQWRCRSQPVGTAVVRAIPIIAAAMIILRIGAVLLHAQVEPAWPRGNQDRVRITRELEQKPGKHLVLVRYHIYPPGHHPSHEWGDHDPDHEFVHNAADIDGSRIVWARDMGDAENQELLNYFHLRRVWLLDGDAANPEPVPYTPSGAAQVAASRLSARHSSSDDPPDPRTTGAH